MSRERALDLAPMMIQLESAEEASGFLPASTTPRMLLDDAYFRDARLRCDAARDARA